MAQSKTSSSNHSETLSGSGNAVTQIVEESLRSGRPLLNLSYRGLKVVPQNISQLLSLRVLLLNNNGLIMPPDEITKLKKLETLSLEHNQLTLLPSDISNLSITLEFLNLSHNPLTHLPPSLTKLENLKELWLAQIGLKSFPTEVCNLCKLEILSLQENEIPDIPEGLGNLTKLKRLSLAGNKLQSLKGDTSASPIASLANLVTFKLQKNEFTELPIQIFSPTLIRLVTVDLGGNKISTVPANMAELYASSAKQLAQLDLRGNNLNNEGVAIVMDFDFILY